MTTNTYAWLGLGAMGGPMAANLVKAGHTVKGYDLSDEAKARATENSIEVVETVAEAVKDVDAIYLSLPAGPHVREVLESPEGIWANATQGTLIIDCSSVDLASSRYCHSGSAERGFNFVDSPVSGSIVGARDATLTFMMGGFPDNVKHAEEHSKPMGNAFFHLGGPSTGMAAKLCNNMMLFSNVVAASESVQMALKLGIDPKEFWNLVNVSTGHSWAVEQWYPVPGIAENSPANFGFAPTGFAAKNAAKDLANALSAADEIGMELPTTKQTRDRLHELMDAGLGEYDSTLVNSLLNPGGKLEGFNPEH